MKDFTVYIDGLEIERIKAKNLKSAEKKADVRWGGWTRNGGSPSFIFSNMPHIKTDKAVTVLETTKTQGAPRLHPIKPTDSDSPL